MTRAAQCGALIWLLLRGEGQENNWIERRVEKKRKNKTCIQSCLIRFSKTKSTKWYFIYRRKKRNGEKSASIKRRGTGKKMHAGKRRQRAKKKKAEPRRGAHRGGTLALSRKWKWHFNDNTTRDLLMLQNFTALSRWRSSFSLNRKGTRVKRTMRGEKGLPSPKPCDFALLSLGECLCKAHLAKKFSEWWATYMLQPPQTWLTRIYACNSVSGVLSLWSSSFFVQILSK